MQTSKNQGGGLRKLIIPAIIIGVIFFLFSGNDDGTTPPETGETQTQVIEKKEGSESTRAEKIGITFDHLASWGEIDSENEKALVMIFNDACTGSDCGNLFVEKFLLTDSSFGQVAQLAKTLQKIQEKNGLIFYQDTDKKVVTGNKIFVESQKGTIYTFELSGKGAQAENFEEVMNTLREITIVDNTNPPPSLPSTTAAPATTGTPTPGVPGSPATAPTTPVVTGPTFKFQSCNDLAAYAKETFYTDFVTQMTKMSAFSDPYTMKLYGRQMITVNDIKQGCISSEGKMFLALIPKGPGTGTIEFHIYKYDLGTKVVKEAQKKGDWTKAVGPSEFGKREGRVIHMSSSAKEGTCINTTSYDYDYIDNIITAKEACSACEGVAQKTCQQL
ncbi:MAG: hypothetical protein AAB551_04190 [Patescibacteria group bacterium]